MVLYGLLVWVGSRTHGRGSVGEGLSGRWFWRERWRVANLNFWARERQTAIFIGLIVLCFVLILCLYISFNESSN